MFEQGRECVSLRRDTDALAFERYIQTLYNLLIRDSGYNPNKV